MGTPGKLKNAFRLSLNCDEGEASTPEQRVMWFHTNFMGRSELWDPLFREAVRWFGVRCSLAHPISIGIRSPMSTPSPAHVMPPYAGEGVDMAMHDALVLFRLLLRELSPSSAIAAYEDEMFARMRSMTAYTMANTEMFYAPDAVESVVAMFRSFGRA